MKSKTAAKLSVKKNNLLSRPLRLRLRRCGENNKERDRQLKHFACRGDPADGPDG